MEKRIYFAGPLFTQAEWEWNKRVAAQLRKQNFQVILPQESAEPMLRKEEPFDAQRLFAVNVEGIENADIVLAVLDQADVDSGTSWECGYAYKSGKPVVGVRSDLRQVGDDPSVSINLMLSKCCKQIIVVPHEKLDDEKWLIQQIIDALYRI